MYSICPPHSPDPPPRMSVSGANTSYLKGPVVLRGIDDDPFWNKEIDNIPHVFLFAIPYALSLISQYPNMADKTGLGALKGAPLVGAITSVCASSFLLFGYDQGVMSGVVISEDWLDAMGQPSTVMTGTITALYDIGGVLGAIGAALWVEDLGRKRGLLVGAALIVIGAILMGSCAERIQFIVGRIVTGLGMSKKSL